jgi:hypothetical protein
MNFNRSAGNPRQASVYGKCIVARYQEVERDMCAKEFQAFKACVTKAVRRTPFVLSISFCAQMGRKW